MSEGMYYPDELIEEVRMKNDIVDVISGYVRLQKKGANYFGLCPFHNEKSPSFSVSPGKQMYYCFGCGAGGNVYTFIQEYENYTFPEAVKMLADRAGVNLPEIEYSEEARKAESKRSKLLEINREAAKYFSKSLVLALPIRQAMTWCSICAAKAIPRSSSMRQDCAMWMKSMACMTSSGTG